MRVEQERLTTHRNDNSVHLLSQHISIANAAAKVAAARRQRVNNDKRQENTIYASVAKTAAAVARIQQIQSDSIETNTSFVTIAREAAITATHRIDKRSNFHRVTREAASKASEMFVTPKIISYQDNTIDVDNQMKLGSSDYSSSKDIATLAKQKYHVHTAANAAASTAIMARRKTQVATVAAAVANRRQHISIVNSSNNLNEQISTLNHSNKVSSLPKLVGIKASANAVSNTMTQHWHLTLKTQDDIFPTHETFSHLAELIRVFDWKAVETYLNVQNRKDPSAREDPPHLSCCVWKNKKGNTLLHLICTIGSAPTSTVRKVLQGWPRAALLQNRYGDTPLHEECKNCQRSLEKAQLLIRHCVESTFIMNSSGRSPLHIACLSNAKLPVLMELIKANPSMLLVKDDYGNTPLDLIFHSWGRNVHMMLAVKSILNRACGEDDWSETSVFGTFWIRMAFLFVKTYSLTHTIPDLHGTTLYPVQTYVESPYLLHAMLQCKKCPHEFLMTAIVKRPYLCQVSDEHGNLPLHVLVSLSLWGTKQKIHQLCKHFIDAFPNAARIANHEGRVPLNIALERGKVTWEYRIQDLFQAAPEAIMARDCKTHLYPFMLAAVTSNESCAEEEQLNTIYHLLRVQPNVIQCGIIYEFDQVKKSLK